MTAPSVSPASAVNKTTTAPADQDKEAPWNKVLSKKKKKAVRLTQMNAVQTFPNMANSTQPSVPTLSRNPWWRKQKVHVYQDSNGKENPKNVERELKSLQQRHDVKINYEVEFHDTYTLPRTFHQMKGRDHSDAIVLINIGTNDMRFKEQRPNTKYSQQNPHFWVKKMIDLLKQQTSGENIVFVASAPSTKFNIAPYNIENFRFCQNEEVGFAHTLALKKHLSRDQYHISSNFLHLIAKTTAAAIIDVNPFQAYKAF